MPMSSAIAFAISFLVMRHRSFENNCPMPDADGTRGQAIGFILPFDQQPAARRRPRWPGEWLGLLMNAKVGGGWVNLAEPIIVRAGEAFIAVPQGAG